MPTWDSIQQFIRILLQFGAGALAGTGVITNEMGTTLVGAVMSLLGIAWWAFWDRKRVAGTPTP